MLNAEGELCRGISETAEAKPSAALDLLRNQPMKRAAELVDFA
jgi:hypothetical protein